MYYEMRICNVDGMDIASHAHKSHDTAHEAEASTYETAQLLCNYAANILHPLDSTYVMHIATREGSHHP